MRRIGLFSGTFNPIHNGHLLIAEAARESHQLEKVLFVTSPVPPHRKDEALLNGKARHAMVLAAVSSNPFFEASDLELKRLGPSYTIDTLNELEQTFGAKTSIHLIIGGDNLNQIAHWKEGAHILAKCTLLVAPRLAEHCLRASPTAVPELTVPEALKNAQVHILDFPGVGFSSSLIRRYIQEGRSVRYMVPDAVYEMLIAENFYKSCHSM